VDEDERESLPRLQIGSVRLEHLPWDAGIDSAPEASAGTLVAETTAWLEAVMESATG
jgi:hypothetical protein